MKCTYSNYKVSTYICICFLSNKFVLFFRSLLSSFKHWWSLCVQLVLLLYFSLYSWPLMVVLGTTRHLLVVVHTCEVLLLLLGLGEEGVREPFAVVLKKAHHRRLFKSRQLRAFERPAELSSCSSSTASPYD